MGGMLEHISSYVFCRSCMIVISLRVFFFDKQVSTLEKL